MLKRWLLMEGLVWRIWLLDWFQITCLNPVYHKFSQKLRRKAILSSSLRYVRNLLGPLVRIFSMSILLYNKFSLETPFLLLAALSWLLILAQTAPPQASARIFLPIPGEPPPQPNHTHIFFQDVKYRNKHLFGQNQFLLVKVDAFKNHRQQGKCQRMKPTVREREN